MYEIRDTVQVVEPAHLLVVWMPNLMDGKTG